MKFVLISIQPKWCELIANGKKTVEVRKTKPKLETPFKVYIYCTKASIKHRTICHGMVINDDELYRLPTGEIKHGDSLELWGDWSGQYDENNFLNGKVIGEFVCDNIFPMSITYSDPESRIALKEFPFTCLTDKEIIDYLGNGKTGYGWHISNLVIYDKPRELSEFHRECERPECEDCPHLHFENTPNSYEGWCIYDEKIPITRPPQSWCYVESEEVGEGDG